MTNSNQLNKRAVTRFTALFICMLIICGIALPLVIYAYSYTVHYINDSNNQVPCVDGYYTFRYSSGQDIYNTFYSSGINFTDVYCACWDTPSQSYVICYVTFIRASSWTNHSPFGNTTAYGWSITANYNGNTFYARNNNAGITLYYQDTEGNTTTHAPKYFYIKQGATCSSGINNFKLTTGDWYQTGYTLTFDSQGGSSISPLTGVSGIVHLGESGEYYPQYVPTLYGYDFVGWSLTENGTVVWDVDVQSDTVLYARWSIQSQYVSIRFGDGFYEDSSCTDDLAGYFGVKGESLTFYAKKKLYQYTDITYDPLEHFYGSIHYSIGSVGYDMQGEMISGSDNPTEVRIYKYTLYLDDSYYIQVNSAPLYKCWFRFSTPDYQEFDTGINYVAWYGQTFAPLWYRETNSYLYTTDSYLGMDLEVWIRLPYIINKPFVFDPALLLGDEYDQRVNHDLRFSEDIVEDNTAYGATIHYHIIANPFQSQETLDESEYVNIILLGKAISDYDITDEYSAVIVYDENSNASWAFSEVELLDTNWSEVNDNIPTKLNSFFGGLFSLSGLAVLIPMVMMVSFAIWFIRRS